SANGGDVDREPAGGLAGERAAARGEVRIVALRCFPHYPSLFRCWMKKAPGVPTAADFRAHFYHNVTPPGEEARKRLLSDWQSFSAQPPGEQRDLELFCIAGGLVAYGHLEMVPHLLKLMPS